MWQRIFRYLGSLYFAIFLIGGLAIILTASTILESRLGTPAAQRFFYSAGWFDLFLGLLAVNIFASTMTRLPFRKKHTGFIVTHIGILLLLAGAFLSRLGGVEGQMVLFESEKEGSILQQKYELVVHREGSGTERLRLETGLPPRRFTLDRIWPGLAVKVHEVRSDAVRSARIIEGPDGAEANAAVRLHIQSGMLGFKDSFWLVEKDSADPASNRVLLGPAVFELKRARAGAQGGGGPNEKHKAEAVIAVRGTSDEAFVDLDKTPSAGIPIGRSGLTIKNFAYYPDARVSEENKLTSISREPRNPAVEFDLEGPGGAVQRVVYFALFPEFEALHGKAAGGLADLDVRFELPEAEGSGTSPRLLIETDGMNWTYKSSGKNGVVAGTLEPGKEFAAGWMDFKILPEELVNRAKVKTSIEKSQQGGMLAADLAVENGGKELWRGWVLDGEPAALPLLPPLADIVLGVGRRTVHVPFNLTLKDFRKVDYPGTQNAMSYESDVILEDPAAKLEIHKTIKMNEPLDYKGFRIFQSSFMQDPAQGEGSVFTVAKNPGISLIYGGAIVLFTGVVLVFFVRPFSSLKS